MKMNISHEGVCMSQGKKVAIGFQLYDLTRIANIRVANMVLAEDVVKVESDWR